MHVRKSTLEFFTQLIAVLTRRLVNREGKVEVVVVMGRKNSNLKKLIRFLPIFVGEDPYLVKHTG
jgi:hypothetical protein